MPSLFDLLLVMAAGAAAPQSGPAAGQAIRLPPFPYFALLPVDGVVAAFSTASARFSTSAA
jgi:hypothetical protein